jgi:hypothetical protein
VLDVEERVALPGHLGALVEAGRLPVGVFLEALATLGADLHPRVVEEVAGALSLLHRPLVQAAPEDVRDRHAAFVRRVLGPALDRIGLDPKPGEEPRTSLLRPHVVRVLAGPGRDARVLAWAGDVASRALRDLASVEPESLALALPIAAWSSDEALWTALRARLPEAPTPQLRVALIDALGSFGDPALLRRSLDLVLDGTLLAQDWFHVSRRSGRLPETARAAWGWLRESHARLAAIVGPSWAPELPALAEPFCSETDAEEVRTFFADPARAPEGTERNVAHALEDIRRCTVLRERLSADLAAWLAAAPR